jgi:signal transduction histidine kinase
MEQVETIAEGRAQTDASLGAERASTDAATDRTAAKAQRVLDDLIERDRIIADERLSKFRDSADRILAHERFSPSPPDDAVAIERRVADKGRKTERKITDAVLAGERQRADAVIETEMMEHEAESARLETHRDETDDQLSTERERADLAVAVLRDTSRALVQAQSDQARDGDVFGMLSRDLRNPLSLIVMNAQMIAEDSAEVATREAAEDILRTAARMHRLLLNLLDVARLEAGTLDVVKQRHDVGALLIEVLQSYRPLFANRAMTFAVEMPVEAVVVPFDHDRIAQVLSNLLGNAMKFTPPNGTIRLHVERRADHVEFVLRDNGPGIDPTVLPHVFKRFWQINSNARRGLGVGLYICEKIVEAHGGRIWVESDLGKGATFRFTLPTS